MSLRQRYQPAEIVLLAVLLLVALAGVMGALCAVVPTPRGEGSPSAVLIPMFLAPALAAGGGLAMVRLAKRAGVGSAPLIAAIILCLVGMSTLGFGITLTLTYDGSDDFAYHLGYSMALCLIPGAFFTLVGSAVYTYAYRQGWRPAAVPPATGAPSASPTREPKLQRAAEYCAQITRLVRRQRRGAFAHQVKPILRTLDEWQSRLRRLIERLDALESDPVIQRDLEEVPASIERLTAQREAEADAQVRTEIEETLAAYREQQEQLQALVTLMRRTEYGVDQALSSLGTIYSQLHLLDAKDIDSGRAMRLQADIEEQVRQLDDQLSAVDEVHRRTRRDPGKGGG